MAVRDWVHVIQTNNLVPGRPMDLVSRWLLITRASVFSMTLTSAVIGGLLAAGADEFHWLAFALSTLALVLAHAANNMINDYFDLESGLDTADYVRAQYAPHPVLDGLISRMGLIAAIAAVNAIDLSILIYLTWLRGWLTPVFALSGLFISVFYVAPPVRLKHIGLGEAGVFTVWGPLMIGGTYFVTAGEIAPWVFAASVPYALLVTTVLVGKHIDKLEADRERGIRTLAVLLGETLSKRLNQALMIAFFALIIALVATGVTGVWTLVALLPARHLPGVLRVYSSPKPERAPEGYPIWPLWYVAWAFRFTRQAGFLFVAGLIADAVWPVHVPTVW